MLIHPEWSWHVRQLRKLRKWKEPRAELKEPVVRVRYRLRGNCQLQRLERAAKSDPAVMACGKRISAPMERYNFKWTLSHMIRVSRRRRSRRAKQ